MPTIKAFRGDYAFLSNFFYAPFQLGEFTYKTVEHAFQSLKAIDPEDQRKIRESLSPAEAKRRGRSVVIRQDWDTVRIDVMRDCLRAKFQGELLARLKLTAPATLIEGNYWGDRFWGVDGIGENWLGRLLMEIRDVN